MNSPNKEPIIRKMIPCDDVIISCCPYDLNEHEDEGDGYDARAIIFKNNFRNDASRTSRGNEIMYYSAVVDKILIHSF